MSAETLERTFAYRLGAFIRTILWLRRPERCEPLRTIHTVLPEIDTAARSYSWVRRVGRMVLQHWIWETAVAGGAAGIVAIISGANPLPTITTFVLTLILILIVYGGSAAIEENRLTELRRLSAEGWQLLHRDLTPERRDYGDKDISQAGEQWIDDYNGYVDRLNHATQKWVSHHDWQLIIKWSGTRYPTTFPAGLYPNRYSNEHNVWLAVLAGQLGALDNAISKRL